jgi:uncharacterized phage-associated protein
MSGSVLDCAKYVLQEKGEMTTGKLRMLVYYCQAWSLAWDGEPLFEEDFEAWANGPVCPELLQKHKGLFRVDERFLSDIPARRYEDDELETMDIVIRDYGDIPPHDLSEMIRQERPWRETRKGIPHGYPCERVISKELMREYYGGLLE